MGRCFLIIPIIWAVVFPLSTAAVAQGTSVDYKLRPDPPEEGDNSLVLHLTDYQGKALEGAKVTLQVAMPAMGTMPRMETTSAAVAKGNGNYEARFNIGMRGSWDIVIEVAIGGAKESFNYSLTTGISGMTARTASSPVRHSGHEGAATVLLPIGPERLQKIGVRFAEAKVEPLTMALRAAGLVEADTTRRTELTLRYGGYIEKQFRGRVGDHVAAGTPLFSVYSPDLVAAQSEFLLAHEGEEATALHRSTAERLKSFGLSTEDLARLRKAGKPERTLVIRAPAGGTLLDINVREGASFSQGQVLYTIGDLSKSYLVGKVFQRDLANLHVGQAVQIVLPEENLTYPGRIDLIYPSLNEGEGTGNVRVVADAPIPDLRPGLYADLRFPVELGSRLTVPSSAVLYSGMNQYVFVDHGGGNLEARAIKTGKSTDEWTEVRTGLSPGERVVASGTFLLSSEAQLRSALPKWTTAKEAKP